MSAGLVLVGVLALGEMLLIVLIARRVRELERKQAFSERLPWLSPGTAVPAFETTAVDGDAVSLDRLRGRHSMVGFFSVGCGPCREQAPVFAEHAAADDGPALAVVIGNADEAQGLVDILAGQAIVVREKMTGPAARAFSAHAFPSIYLLDPQGKVLAAGPSVDAVTRARPDLAAARQ